MTVWFILFIWLENENVSCKAIYKITIYNKVPNFNCQIHFANCESMHLRIQILLNLLIMKINPPKIIKFVYFHGDCQHDANPETKGNQKNIYIYLIYLYLYCVWKWSRSVVSDSFNPMNYSLPGSSTHRIFQANALEWVAISFSRPSSQPKIEPGYPAL